MVKKYDRHVLHENPKIEVVHIKWPPGAESRPHDHGKSYGKVKVLSGKVFQLVFDKKTKKFLRRDVMVAGDVMIETPDLIHIMGNDSKTEIAETLHVYTPKLVMKYYSLAMFKWPGMPKLKKKRRRKSWPPKENLTKKWGPKL
ncbi:MAG: hypothetical protein G01um10143_216 [Parcubacteria group bacterium Gr01-1014_3]|nr:MAG: hypothetical protein G01um10143_216 [Parcubacteria group bacterium Gr01-1014_3]